jgi:hypothetical protein
MSSSTEENGIGHPVSVSSMERTTIRFHWSLKILKLGLICLIMLIIMLQLY